MLRPLNLTQSTFFISYMGDSILNQWHIMVIGTSKRTRVCRITSAGGVVRTKWGWAWSAGATEDLSEASAHWWGISEWIFLLN